MGCCLTGCLRALLVTLWRALLAALVALLFARVDAYVERRGWGETMVGRAYRMYRQRGKRPPPA
jgi:ABC-type sulfate transport system permease component